MNHSVRVVPASQRQTLQRTNIFLWILQVVAAIILLQTLFFKFTYPPETQVIFRDLGGRLAATIAGSVELVAVVLLLWPRLSAVGAAVALGTMIGAIGTHLFFIGIAVSNPVSGENDGGFLFVLALIVATCSAIVLFVRRRQLPWLGSLLH